MQKLENPESSMFQQDQTVFLLRTMQCYDPDIHYFNANFQRLTPVEHFISLKLTTITNIDMQVFQLSNLNVCLCLVKRCHFAFLHQSEACFKDSVEKKHGRQPTKPHTPIERTIQSAASETRKMLFRSTEMPSEHNKGECGFTGWTVFGRA